jgi:photosystem II stability/assembly factor-like uncharacterized protein
MNTEISRLKAGILSILVALTAVPAAAQDGPEGILQAIGVDREEPALVYTSGAGCMWRSFDSGTIWEVAGCGVIAWSIIVDTPDLIADPDGKQVIYAATQDNGVIRSENGVTWTAGNGLSGTARSIAVHPVSQVVYAGTEDGIYVSNDRGLNWDILSNALGAGATQGLVVDPGNAQALYATKWGQGVYRSIDGGISWDLGNSGLFDTQLFDLDLHPQNPSVLYAATPAGVFQSVDAGANWVLLDSPQRASELAVDPANPERLVVVTEGNGISRSTDGGQTWTAINEGLGNVTQFVSVAIPPGGSGVVHAGSVNSGIFVSNNFGDTWFQTYTPAGGGTPPGPITPPPTDNPPADPTTLTIQVINRSAATVELGQTVFLDVVVRNTGSFAAQNAQVRHLWEQVGQGSYAMTARWSGGTCSDGTCNLGSLPANSEIVVSVEGRTGDAYNWVGPFSLVATAEADNASAVSDSARVETVRTVLSIESESGGGASGPFFMMVLLLVMLGRAASVQRSWLSLLPRRL